MKELLLIDDDLSFSIEALNVLKNINSLRPVHKSTLSASREYLNEKNPKFIITSTDFSSRESVFELIEESKVDALIIFFSEDYSQDLYNRIKDFNYVAYMIKPFNVISLISIIEAIEEKKEEKKEKDLFYFRKKGKLIPLVKKNISYIYTEGNYCIINHEGKEHMLRYPLGKLLKDLNYNKIIRSHRRFAININMIDELDISNNQCLIQGKEVPIGRLYKKELKNLLANTFS